MRDAAHDLERLATVDGAVTPAEAIETAELAEAEIRYRNELAREMSARGYERGMAEGYARAAADVKALQHGLVRDAEPEALRWGPGGRAASPTRGRAISPAGSNPNPNANWRQAREAPSRTRA
jgi:hypothetical protein